MQVATPLRRVSLSLVTEMSQCPSRDISRPASRCHLLGGMHTCLSLLLAAAAAAAAERLLRDDCKGNIADETSARTAAVTTTGKRQVRLGLLSVVRCVQ